MINELTDALLTLLLLVAIGAPFWPWLESVGKRAMEIVDSFSDSDY